MPDTPKRRLVLELPANYPDMTDAEKRSVVLSIAQRIKDEMEEGDDA